MAMPIRPAKPAIVGHLSLHLQQLNEDAARVLHQLFGWENTPAHLFSRTAQNSPRQQIRQIYLTTLRPFLIGLGIACTGAIDPDNGLGYLTNGWPETSLVWNGHRSNS